MTTDFEQRKSDCAFYMVAMPLVGMSFSAITGQVGVGLVFAVGAMLWFLIRPIGIEHEGDKR